MAISPLKNKLSNDISKMELSFWTVSCIIYRGSDWKNADWIANSADQD